MSATWLYPAPDVDDLWDASDLLRRGYVVVLGLAVGMAVVVLAGSESRIAGASFAVVRRTGGHLLWGAVFAALAAALVIGRSTSRHALGLAMQCGAVIHLLWGISFAESAWQDHHADFTGPIAYAALAAMHVSQALEYRRRATITLVAPPPGDSP